MQALSSMDVAGLRAAWRRLYRQPAPPKLRRDTLELAVAWQLQARALGGLSATSQRVVSELASQVEARTDLPQPRQATLRPGARLVRQWGGETHEVLVIERGFVWRDRIWASLSAIAREITGARWSGPRFFGLDRTRRTDRSSPAGEGAGAAQ